MLATVSVDAAGARNNSPPIAQNVRFGSWLCENSSTGRVRRRFRRNRVSRESNLAAYIWLDAAQENSIFHVSLMCEFLHSQGQKRRSEQHSRRVCFALLSGKSEASSVTSEKCQFRPMQCNKKHRYAV